MPELGLVEWPDGVNRVDVNNLPATIAKILFDNIPAGTRIP
jgi:hypothetical protein